MRIIKLLVGSSLLLASSIVAAVEAPASIATVGKVSGNVLIEHADKRIAAKEGMPLVEGDTVFVLEKATVALAYAACNTVLDQNTLLTISADAPCATGMQIGVGAPAAGAAAATTTTAAGVGTGVVVAGVVAGAVVVGVAVDNNSGGGSSSGTGTTGLIGSNQPASPAE